MQFQSLTDDQAREYVNTQQRFQAFLDARELVGRHKGSMSFGLVKGSEYLMRSYYDRNGSRKTGSLGIRGTETEKTKAEFDAAKREADEMLSAARKSIERQALINKAIGLGRVPGINARILRQLDASGLMQRGARLIGTNCIFAYEAAAGVRVKSEITATGDIDILMDARAKMRLIVEDDTSAISLMALLARVDRSFHRTPRTYQAANRDGFLVDLVKPMPAHPDRKEPMSVSEDPNDLVAAEIDGLEWHVNSPVFTAVAIDLDGFPVRIVAPDPVAFAVHKLWLSKRSNREPVKKGRDERQARAVAQLVSQHLPHLAFDPLNIRQFPKELVDQAAAMFETNNGGTKFDW